MVKVGIVMGSDSDWPIMKKAAAMLKDFGIGYEAKVISAHRTPDLCTEYVTTAVDRGIKVLIGGAGMAAHLPGVMASLTPLPVIGVPISSKLDGMDALLAIVQMPKGIPVATVAIDNAANAALLALRILGIEDPDIRAKLEEYRLADEARIKAIKLEGI
ncbi:MAG: 5-(carboxyamino)imidazole ribonucleotide mutase [Alphaproteobacteria bacterium]|nr:5-(carboxyamino)imidazole ribonucleotide mutase [Alphaproteobacteria bacterium]